MKPGPCPACGEKCIDEEGMRSHLGDHGWAYAWCDNAYCALSGPVAETLEGAIAAWNGIRARVLREAGVIAENVAMHNNSEDAVFVAEKIHEAADRAERGGEEE